MTVPLKITQHQLFGSCVCSGHTDSGSKNVSVMQVGVFQHLKYHHREVHYEHRLGGVQLYSLAP